MDCVWSYELIDFDLIRDDLDSAADISPRAVWTTREAALEALRGDLLDLWVDCRDTDDEEMPDLEWRATDTDDEQAEIDWMGRMVARLYPLKVKA